MYGTGFFFRCNYNVKQKKNKIYPYSRTFLYPFARPLNQKLLNPTKLEHKEIIFNYKLIKKLKKKKSEKIS